MAKRLSAKQKEEIIQYFLSGKTIEELSIQFDCTKLTITRNLKKKIGEKKYEELINLYKKTNSSFKKNKQNINLPNKKEIINCLNLETTSEKIIENNHPEEECDSLNSFMEIIPLDFEIEKQSQKDLASIPISDVSFPKMVYLIVGKKIELEIKYLKDYPAWSFLAEDELNRKTIEIFDDYKIAKRFCNKEQKVIKVPNTDVFRIAAPFLISKGISRIVSPENLISL